MLGALAVLVPALGLPYLPALTVAAAFVVSLASQGIKIVTDTTLQLEIEDDYRGRVFSVNDTAFNLIFVAGIVAGALALPADGESPPGDDRGRRRLRRPDRLVRHGRPTPRRPPIIARRADPGRSRLAGSSSRSPAAHRAGFAWRPSSRFSPGGLSSGSPPSADPAQRPRELGDRLVVVQRAAVEPQLLEVPPGLRRPADPAAARAAP